MRKLLVHGGSMKDFKATKFDKAFVLSTKKKHPKILYLPTATNDASTSILIFKQLFQKQLKAKVDVLYLANQNPTAREIEKKIFSHDAIYIEGGNTIKLLKRLRFLGVDKILKKAYEKGIVMGGSSAGAVCWYEYGFSDAKRFYNPKNWKFIKLRGMGILKGILSVHFKNKRRKKEFPRFFKKSSIKEAIAIDDFCGVLYEDEKPVKVIRDYSGVNAYKIIKEENKIKIKPLLK